jgi:hypothetical protein
MQIHPHNFKRWLHIATLLFGLSVISQASDVKAQTNGSTPDPSNTQAPGHPADVDNNGSVNVADLQTLITHFNRTQFSIRDPLPDGIITIFDYAIVVEALIAKNATLSPTTNPVPSIEPSPTTTSPDPQLLPPAKADEKVLMNDIVQFAKTDNGFRIMHTEGTPLPSGVPTNWIKPIDYFKGIWHYRLEVIQHPTAQAGKIQLCMWNMPGFDPENCAFNIDHSGVGTYLASSSPAINGATNGGWARIVGGALDFLNPTAYRMSLVLRGPGNCVVSTKGGIPENKRCPEYWDAFKDLKFKITVVMVKAGHQFSGWNNY